MEGLDAIARFWDAERDGADEDFSMSSEVVAVVEETAVVREIRSSTQAEPSTCPWTCR